MTHPALKSLAGMIADYASEYQRETIRLTQTPDAPIDRLEFFREGLSDLRDIRTQLENLIYKRSQL